MMAMEAKEIFVDSFDGPIVLGTCENMSPEKECIMRETEGLLHSFEIASGQPENLKRPLADPDKVVKQYSRPAAGRLEIDPSELRPAPVLKRTMSYLLTNIATLEKPAWTDIYAFIFDRIRAVRQDMVIQGISSHDAIHILELAVRFHMYAAYRLRHSDISGFDPVMNKHHLIECLKRLLYLYKVTDGHHPNRPEFEAAYLLDSLGNEIVMLHYLDLPLELRTHPLLRKAFEINLSFTQRDYIRALRQIQLLPSCICLCIVSSHLYNLQVNYLQILSHGYNVKNCQFPVICLSQLLHCTSNKETVDLCTECGLIDMFDQGSSDFIQFRKNSFRRPAKEKAIPSLPVLDKILHSIPLSEILGVKNEPSQHLKSSADTRCGFSQVVYNGYSFMQDKTNSKSTECHFVRKLEDFFDQLSLNKNKDSPSVCAKFSDSCDRQNVQKQQISSINNISDIHNSFVPSRDKINISSSSDIAGVSDDTRAITPRSGRGRGRGRGMVKKKECG